MNIHLRDICSVDWLCNHQPPTHGLLIGIDASLDRDELIDSFIEFYDVAVTNQVDCDARLAGYLNTDIKQEFESYLDDNDTVAEMETFINQIPDDSDYGECKAWFDVTMD